MCFLDNESSSVSTTFLLLCSFSFGIDLGNEGLDARFRDHLGNVARLDDAKFDVLRGFDDFKEGLDSETHGGLLIQTVSVLLLKVLAEFLRLLANSTGFPLTDST